ncbi:MAG: DUF1559 domain-containing protein, partial [Gemmataceae bacterium]
IHNYASANGDKLPMLGEFEEGGHWTAFILPYMEQDNVFRALSFGSNDFARAAPSDPVITSTNNIDRNIAACGTNIKSFRCPSSTVPDRILDASCYSPPWFANRVPCNYLGVVTGVQPNDWKPSWGWGASTIGSWGTPSRTTLHPSELDGMMITRPRGSTGRMNRVANGGTASPVGLLSVTDGLSNTAMLGEAEPEENLLANAVTQETPNSGRKDHWYIGGDDLDNWEGTDWSECGGSLGTVINTRRPTVSRSDTSPEWGAYEVSFSSRHSGGANFCMGDGSVRFIRDNTAQAVLTAVGTRAGGEVATLD